MIRPRSAGRSNDEDLKKKITPAAVWRVLSLAKPYKGLLIGSGLLSLMGAGFQLAIPLVSKLAADKITHTTQVGEVDLFAALLAGLVVVSAFIGYAQFVLSAYAGNRIIKELRENLFAHLQRLPVAYFDRVRSGDIGSHLSNDVSQLQTTLATDISGLLGTMVLLIGGAVIAVILNWRLACIALVVMACIMGFFVITGRRLRKMNRAALDALADAMGTITEAVANIRLVKAFARESYEDRRASEKLGELLKLSIRSSRIEGLMMTVGVSGSFLMLIACMWYGSRGIIQGDFSTGDVAGFVMAIFIVLPPMASFASLFTRLQRTVGASERLFAILDEGVETPDAEDAVDFPAGPGAVRYENIHFSYLTDQPVLTGATLELAAGKVTAVVGPSGSGKTTLASLLYRFYEPDSGAISLNGVSINRIKRSSLRGNIGIVPQDPILFNGTILENIRYGRLDATEAEVREAATSAHVDEFVSTFNDGYETWIGERGVTLSGGQRQRVAIARALLKNPKVLILDEATSALDAKSESLVRDALDRLMANRTTMVIAHRLSTVRNADLIAVVAEGRIVETGRHSDLLERGGKYAELYELVDA